MSDPRYRDPRLDPPPLQEDDIRSQRLNELESSNAMWGWVAGAVVLALVLMFVFTRGQVTDTTASNTCRRRRRPPPARRRHESGRRRSQRLRSPRRRLDQGSGSNQ